jgi:hypothetical protein
MLTLVPSLSLSAAMVSTSRTAGNALLNGRAAGSIVNPAVASFYDAGERPTWPALLARGGTGAQMAAADVAEADLIAADSIAADPMFFDESKAIAELGFAISEEELLLKAKEYLYYGQGVARPELLASDFVFMGPFVGGAGGSPSMLNGSALSWARQRTLCPLGLGTVGSERRSALCRNGRPMRY